VLHCLCIVTDTDQNMVFKYVSWTMRSMRSIQPAIGLFGKVATNRHASGGSRGGSLGSDEPPSDAEVDQSCIKANYFLLLVASPKNICCAFIKNYGTLPS